MKRAPIFLLVVLLSLVAVASAQAPQAPKPAPELQRLNYFAGNWKSDSDMKASPFGPAGKVTSKDHYEWMAGKFFLVYHSTMSGAMGPGTEMAVMGYNTPETMFPDSGPVNIRFPEADFRRAWFSVLQLPLPVARSKSPAAWSEHALKAAHRERLS